MNKKIISLLLVFLITGSFNYSFGEESIDTSLLSIRSLLVKGAKSNNLLLGEFTKVENLRTKKYLKEFTVFAVRELQTFAHPTGHFASILIKDGDMPVFLNNMSEAAVFLSKRIGKVETKEKAKEAMLLLPEIFSYKVITVQPEEPLKIDFKALKAKLNDKNITKKTKERILYILKNRKDFEIKRNINKSDWTFIFEETKTGWSLTCTLLFDTVISFCKRVTISVDKSGKLSVSKMKHIYDVGSYM